MKIISFIEKRQTDVIERIATSLCSVAAALRQPVSPPARLLNIVICGAIPVIEALLRRVLMINFILSYNTLIAKRF